MKTLWQLARSSLGRKYLMAATGLTLVAFVVVHMVGNLKVFLGADDLNHYAHMLKHRAWALWGFRLGLLAVAAVHVACAITLAVENRRARPQAYARARTMRASLASVTMVVSGLLVLAFVVFHLLHFTVKVGGFAEYDRLVSPIPAEAGIMQAIAPVEAGVAYPDVYEMVVSAFSRRWLALVYLAGVGLLSFHLSHGLQSMFQSMGWRSDASGPFLAGVARVVAAAIFLGMAAVPAAVQLGLVR
jgi:succinate dehydrogenase / fumarate reductase cytochrome b subunit